MSQRYSKFFFMKPVISVLFLICLICFVQCQNKDDKRYKLLIDTYTNSDKIDGIYYYEFNSETGDLNLKSKIAGEDNPSYATVSKNGKYVYSVNEVKNGTISAYSLNRVTGELTFLNRISSGGSGPCFVLLDEKNRLAFVANYGSGSLSVISLKDNGSLNNNIQFIQNQGSSIDNRRQQGPHVHGAFLTPDKHYLLSPDLGTDRINIYRYDPTNTSKPLIVSEPAFVSVKAGNGPRLITFHPNSRFAYLIQEMGGVINVYDYKNGTLTEKQTITILSPDFKGRIGASDIHISSEGRFLYASNRGDANEIVIFVINKYDGKLTYVGRQQSMGKTPRSFVIDPTGNFLLVGNQESNEIIVFKRDQKSGLLTPINKKIEISRPVCLKFLEPNE